MTTLMLEDYEPWRLGAASYATTLRQVQERLVGHRIPDTVGDVDGEMVRLLEEIQIASGHNYDFVTEVQSFLKVAKADPFDPHAFEEACLDLVSATLEEQSRVG